MINTYVELLGLNLESSAMPASGAFGFGDVLAAKKFDLSDLGATIIKTITPHATISNPRSQTVILDIGVLNSAELTNPGVDAVIEGKLTPLHQSYPALPIMANVGGEDETGYIEVAQELSDSGLVSALEISVSCPNVNQGGMSPGVHPGVVGSLTKKIKTVTNVPIYVKLTPDVTDIIQIVKTTEKSGAGGLSLINTLLGMDTGIKTRKPVLGHSAGGFSGEAVRLVVLRAVHQVRQSTNLPIVGMGGISLAQDIIRFIFAGANAAAVRTAHFKDNIASKHIADELPNELEKLGIEDIDDLVNQVEFN